MMRPSDLMMVADTIESIGDFILFCICVILAVAIPSFTVAALIRYTIRLIRRKMAMGEL